jgi:hypothetical protein
VQVRFRRSPEAPPETPAVEAALAPLYLGGIVFWDEHHKMVLLGSRLSGAEQRRVVEDMGRLISVLGKFLRTGRRAVRVDGKIATQESLPHHPDLNFTYVLLLNTGHTRSHTLN